MDTLHFPLELDGWKSPYVAPTYVPRVILISKMLLLVRHPSGRLVSAFVWIPTSREETQA
jgi:hypothetical protein